LSHPVNAFSHTDYKLIAINVYSSLLNHKIPVWPLTQTPVYDKFFVLIEKINLVANKKTAPVVPDFEGSLQKLETIVNKMESGDLSLEEALSRFEEGVALARQCQHALRQAEQRVQQLMNNPEAPEK